MKANNKRFEGIILSTVNYGENHKIFKILTPDLGIISFMAHRVRKMNNPFRGIIEILNHIEIIAYDNNASDIKIIKEVQLIKSYSVSLRYEQIWMLMPFLKLIPYFHFENAKENSNFFLMLIALLNAIILCNTENEIKILLSSFAFKAYIMSSLITNFKTCMDCGQSLVRKPFYLAINNEVLCEKCIKNQIYDHYFSEDFQNFLMKIIYSKFEKIIYLIPEINHYEKDLKTLLDKITRNLLQKKWSEFEIQENPFNQEI